MTVLAYVVLSIAVLLHSKKMKCNLDVILVIYDASQLLFYLLQGYTTSGFPDIQ